MLHKLFIDHHLAKSLKPYSLRKMDVVSKIFPGYRFVDYHNAVDAFLADKKTCAVVNSTHGVEMMSLVKGKFASHEKRVLNRSSSRVCTIGFEENQAVPDCKFWSFIDEKNSRAGVIRVREFHSVHAIDLALSQPSAMTSTLDELDKLSEVHSVYRNKYLQVDMQPAIDDGYSNYHQGIEVSFKREPAVTDAEIIFDPVVKKLITRNIISFMENRERLNDLGLPMQRGVLFYGPPGTGKSFTCQYLYGQLKPITMITVAGKGLGEVRSICNLARMLQPSVLLLEDVDLIFAAREINLYSTALGEMMDELDAFKKNDSVIFIMTTNSIERLEKAIKDRPGRVAQCIHFGPPTIDLREKYLARYLQGLDSANVSTQHVASLTEGASQAFLEELVYRAIQIGAEIESQNGNKQPGKNGVVLTNEIFDEAVEEMTNRNNSSTNSIIGFTSGNRS